MLVIYCDAGTSGNGNKGHQKTRVALWSGGLLLDKEIGDYSNNEGELTAIVLSLKEGATQIYSDSQTAIGWVKGGWTKGKQKRLSKGLLTERHKKMISLANSMWLLFGCPNIDWIPREENKAGIYIENKYGI